MGSCIRSFESHVANSKVTCVKSLQKFSQNVGRIGRYESPGGRHHQDVGCYNPPWIGKLRNPNDGVHFQETYRWCSYHQLEKNLGNLCWLPEPLLPLRTLKMFSWSPQGLMAK